MTGVLPKAIIHEHLEGSVTPEMACFLAEKYAVTLPSSFVFASGEYDHNDFPHGRYAYDESDFGGFIATYDFVSHLVRSAEDYYLITKDFLSRNAQQGLIYCELITSPFHMCAREDKEGELSFDASRYHELMAAVEKAISDVEAEYGLVTRLQAVGVRHLGADNVSKVVDFILQNPRASITGFNIAGDERSGMFADFDYAHKAIGEIGLGKSYHAGEICPSESISMALIAGASRIGHGIKAVDNEELIHHLVECQITLEIAMTSNRILVNELAGQMVNHPVRKLYDKGVRVSLNTDDAGIFGTDIGKEYRIASEVFSFSRPELLDITLCTIEAGFVDAETKQRLIGEVYRSFSDEDVLLLKELSKQVKNTALAERLTNRYYELLQQNK